jgi:putative heme transporter
VQPRGNGWHSHALRQPGDVGTGATDGRGRELTLCGAFAHRPDPTRSGHIRFVDDTLFACAVCRRIVRSRTAESVPPELDQVDDSDEPTPVAFLGTTTGIVSDGSRCVPAGGDKPSSMEPTVTHLPERPLDTGELPELPRTTGTSTPPARRHFRFTLKLLAMMVATYFFVLPLIPGFRSSWTELQRVEPTLLIVGLLLEIAALFCYALLTRAALGAAGHHISRMRMFRIQMSTRALSSIVPGGSAAGSALGYRLLTLSGVSGPDAGFGLGTVGLGSAVVLNLLLWCGLIVSIPVRGVNPLYGFVAVVGIVVMAAAGAIVFGLMEGQGRAERVVRWAARRVRVDEDKAALALNQVGLRLEQLVRDKQLLGRVAFWAALNWLLDAGALWVFVRAFGASIDPDALIVAFGIANVLAAVPITPAGLGYVDTGYITMFVGFGIPRRIATLGIGAYRFAQFFFPMLLGGLLYLSLRVGPWSIERRERLKPLRDVAAEETERGESKIDFALRFGPRDDTTTTMVRPDLDDLPDSARDAPEPPR